jgi:hypothetical protein
MNTTTREDELRKSEYEQGYDQGVRDTLKKMRDTIAVTKEKLAVVK